MNMNNINPEEIAKFSLHASQWWDLHGDLKTLHQINPIRLEYINNNAPLNNKSVIDVGCGGGILSESMAQLNANVTGIDMSQAALQAAKLHLFESKLQVDYILSTAEAMAETKSNSYDVVTCLEMLEHVPDPLSIITACAKLVKPNGDLFFSTLNRNVISYLGAIVGAEYLLHLLPKNTHDYAKFIRPSELAQWGRLAGLELQNIAGITYNFLTQKYSLSAKPTINYLVHFKKHF
jgi:2-polyprenyl-6-hydroxyphenyl methylase/3-demethylubiquinone-9 3-methyltransferase